MRKAFSDETNTVLVDITVPDPPPMNDPVEITMPRHLAVALRDVLGDLLGGHELYPVYDALDEALKA